jgi:hypothetical protein
MNINLLLSLSYRTGNEGILYFKTEGKSLRINRLSNILGFVGNMKQLSQAIHSYGKQDCAYEMTNWQGLQWVLNCTFKKGFVALDIWFQKMGFSEELNTAFSWQGNALEFGETIDLMIEKAGPYKYFRRH